MNFIKKNTSLITGSFILIAIIITSVLIYNFNILPAKTETVKNKIYTTFYPLQYITKEIAGESFDVINLTPPGTEPHDYEPSAKILAELNSAKAFVYIGEEIDPWASKKAQELDQMKVFTIAVKDKIKLQNAGGILDPHFWQRPKLLVEFSKKLNEELSTQFPSKAYEFQNNLSKFVSKVNLLDSFIQTSLQKCQSRKMIVSHNAFNYLATDYNLEIVPINGLSPEGEPSSQQIAQIINLVKEERVKYIFLESFSNQKITDVITNATQVEALELNPIETLTQENLDLKMDYITIFYNNINNIKLALNCE